MEKIFVGIDPSINSTGVCLLYFEDDILKKEQFYIVKPDTKPLSKKEQKAQDELLNFDYLVYHKEDLSLYKEDNHKHEYYKTTGLIEEVNTIHSIFADTEHIGWQPDTEIYIVIEGISYGSTLKTKSVFDLAGLNYMIRQKLLRDNSLYLTIATPSQIKKYATGNGNCNKEAIINLFSAIHPKLKLPKIDDIADAYFMAKYARKLYNEKNKEDIL